jgi:hypothetical protein
MNKYREELLRKAASVVVWSNSTTINELLNIIIALADQVQLLDAELAKYSPMAERPNAADCKSV